VPPGPTGATGPAGADGADGAPGTTAVTRLDIASTSDNSITGTVEQLLAVGTFTKSSATSRIKLTWNGHIRGTGALDWFCDFQLRIDGAEPPGSGGRAVLYSGGGVQNDSTAGATAFFNGLGAGSRAVSLWVRGSGTTLSCAVNTGSFPDEIFVEETPA
jgi:hypothetical protein